MRKVGASRIAARNTLRSPPSGLIFSTVVSTTLLMVLKSFLHRSKQVEAPFRIRQGAAHFPPKAVGGFVRYTVDP